MKLNQKTVKKIIKYFSKKPEVATVYLYGSYARGDAKIDSDIDLAVLVTDTRKYKGSGIPQVVFALDLSKIAGKKVEVQDLTACSVEFAHRVLSEGKLLTSNNEKDRVNFQTSTVRKYFDLKPILDEYNYYLAKIIKRGELHVRYPTH